MNTNNSLTANNFSFYDPLSYGYENNKALCPDYQAIILVNQPSS